MVVYYNGQFLPKDKIHISPDDRGFLFGDGIYEGIRSVAGRPFELKAHLDRMRAGATSLRLNAEDVDCFEYAIPELLVRNGLGKGGSIYLPSTDPRGGTAQPQISTTSDSTDAVRHCPAI